MTLSDKTKGRDRRGRLSLPFIEKTRCKFVNES